MNIAFFGSSLVSAYWNGAATYYRGMLKALAARGHRTIFYEPDAYSRQQHRDIEDPPWAAVSVYEGERGALEALRAASSADVIVKASGVGVFDELLESRVVELKKAGQRAIFWDVDAPATLARLRRDPNDPFHALVPEYDLILTYGGGPPVVEGYVALGARRCVPIYNALDPEEHRPAEPDRRFAGDVGFLGNRLPDRERRVEAFLFSAARVLSKKTFVLGGSGWDGKLLPPNLKYVGHVYTYEHNAFNASLGVALNVNRDSMAEVGFSPATRVFEAAGAGACMVSDSWPGIETFLEPGEEILLARDASEVVEHVVSLTPERRRAIGDAARARVLRDHTYAQRALEVERALGVDSAERAR